MNGVGMVSFVNLHLTVVKTLILIATGQKELYQSSLQMLRSLKTVDLMTGPARCGAAE